MNRFIYFFFPLFFVAAMAIAQQSPAPTDSLAVKAIDSSSLQAGINKYQEVLKENPWFNFMGKPVSRVITEKKHGGKENVFYLLAALFFLLAVIRATFGRYIHHLFSVFFRASMKQKQIREQLLQAPLASLLLNLLFIATGGLFVTFILKGKLQNEPPINFWLLYAYSVAGLIILYLGKFFFLKILGWTLRMTETTDAYIFIVFMCNKVLAIILLPLLLGIAFGSPDLATVAFTVSYVLVAGIFAYRYISSYGYINREVRTSRFHFFLYLCAFEVAPLLLIYKVLMKIV